MIRGVARSVAAGAVTLAIVMITSFGPNLASSTAQTSPVTTSAGAPHLVATAITPFVGPDGTFAVSLDATSLPSTARLSMVIHYPISSRSRLDRTIAGEQLGTILYATPNRALAELGGAAATIALPIAAKWPAPADGTVLSDAGVYPVEIIATDANGSRIDSLVTHLLRIGSPDSTTPALSVGAIVAIDATPEIDADHAPVLSEDASARASRLLGIVDDRSIAPPLSLAAEPFVLDGLRREGTTLRLPTNTNDRETLLRPYVSIDAGSMVAANLGHVVDEEYVAGDDTLTSAYEVQPDHHIAVIDRTTSPTALDRLALVGTNSVVIGSEQIRNALANGGSNVLTRTFVITSANGTAFTTIASDDVTADRLRSTDAVLGAHEALAELAMLHVEQPTASRGVAVAIPADIAPDALRAFLSGLRARAGDRSGSIGRPLIEPVTLGDLFDRTAAATNGSTPTAHDWTSVDPTGLGTWPTAIDQALWDLDGLRSTIPEDPDTIGTISRELLASADAGLTDLGRLTIVAGSESRIRSTAASISLPSSQTMTLTSRSGKLPLVVTNDLPVEARIRVRLDSPKLEFPGGTDLELVLAPSSTTRTDIEVTTRASGAFPLDISLTSANGKLLLDTGRVTVRSTAISGWGLVLSIGAGLFLLIWWARHWRSSRREDLTTAAEPSASQHR